LNVVKESVGSLLISNVPALDPIRVICIDTAPGSGRIIIQCYGQAWTGCWSAMGDRTVEQFFVDCDPGYLVNAISGGRMMRDHEAFYVRRVVCAVQEALRNQPIEFIPKAAAASDNEALHLATGELCRALGTPAVLCLPNTGGMPAAYMRLATQRLKDYEHRELVVQGALC
jgi:hypothetical protein